MFSISLFRAALFITGMRESSFQPHEPPQRPYARRTRLLSSLRTWRYRSLKPWFKRSILICKQATQPNAQTLPIYKKLREWSRKSSKLSQQYRNYFLSTGFFKRSILIWKQVTEVETILTKNLTTKSQNFVKLMHAYASCESLLNFLRISKMKEIYFWESRQSPVRA